MARKAFEIERDIADAKAAYHDAAETETAAALADRHNAIKKLGAELQAVYTKGAVGDNLFGMKVGPGKYEITDGTKIAATDADGNELLDADKQPILIAKRSRGETPDEAVANWNAGDYFQKAGVGVVKEAA